MIPPRRAAALIVLAAVLAATAPGIASQRVHAVLAGESASSLAKRYYGDRDLGDLLLRYNGKSGRVIHPGELLTIPYCEVRRAQPGDTWSGLAQRHLGRGSVSPGLAELNGFPPGEPLRIGERIVLPVILRHTLVRGETLASLAERFYGDDRKTRILQVFSRIEDPKRLAVGTVLEIPLIAFTRPGTDPVAKSVPERAVAAKTQAPPTAAPAPEAPGPAKAAEPGRNDPATAAAVAPSVVPVVGPAKPIAETPRFGDRIAEAGRCFSDGDYDRAREALEALRQPVAAEGTAIDRRELGRLLAFVYIALDLDDRACEAYRAAPAPEGPEALDPDLVSPRIREALAKCPAVGTGLERLDTPARSPQIPSHAGEERRSDPS